MADVKTETWQPIETYDALPMNRRPKLAVFYFEATPGPRPHVPGLAPTVELQRTYGRRVCTHWMPLPDPPA